MMPHWSAAEDSLHDAQHRSDSSHEHSAPPGNLHVKRIEMLEIHEEAKMMKMMKMSMKPMLPWGTLSVS